MRALSRFLSLAANPPTSPPPGTQIPPLTQGNSDYLLTLSRVMIETHDRAVLIELIALVGWLANTSDDYAQLLGPCVVIIFVCLCLCVCV